MSLKGKIALVTGASRGLGRAIAENLAKAGAIVIGTATSESGAETITNYLAEFGENKSKGLVLDIANPDNVEHLLATMKDSVGHPSILVNNAGITGDELFLRMKEDSWNKVIDTNLTGTYRLMKACIRSMIKARFGRIVNLSSVVAFTGNAGQASYSASKAGIVGLSKSVAQEVASRGITINVVAPGFIKTDMTGELNEQVQEKLLEKIPVGTMGEPADIANAVSFLVSEGARYITGETIHVNGGMLMN